MESLAEFVQFMQPNQRLDLKAVALTHILGERMKIVHKQFPNSQIE